MNTAVLSGAFALAGVLLGGVATHVLSLLREREARKHSLDLEHRRMLREKYEQLYSLVARWALAISTNSIGFSAAMQGKITYDDANDLFIKSTQGKQLDFERIDLLIDAYAPTCRTSYDRCIAWRSKGNAIHAEFRREYDAKGPFGSYDQLPAYTEAMIGFEKESETLKNQIIAQLRQLR